MKVKYLIPILLIVLVFGFTGCSASSSVKTIESLEKTIESLEKIIEANITAETTSPPETIETQKNKEEATTTAEATHLNQDDVSIELADELVSNGYDVRYIDYSENEHPYEGYFNWVQIGIKDESIPISGNYGGPSYQVVEDINNIIKKHYPDSEVWIICFFNDLNSHYSHAVTSIPELNIGGASMGKSPEKWIYQGIDPLWVAGATTTTTEAPATTTTVSKEVDVNAIKEGVIGIIEGSYEGRKVQKFSFEDDKLFVEYSSGNWVEDILKKDMFEFMGSIADLFVINNFQFPITMKANSEIGSGYLKSTTSFETLIKINNLEMGFEDWVNNTKFEVKDLY